MIFLCFLQEQRNERTFVKEKFIMIELFEKYLTRQCLYGNEPLRFSTIEMVVVIPCFDEQNICLVIESLSNNILPVCNIEIIVVLNAPENATNNQIKQNEYSYSELCRIKQKLPLSINLRIICVKNIPLKYAGVGFARKIGMDEAIRLFFLSKNMTGIIISLDADCLVENNYLQIIYSKFHENKKINTAVIYFEHILPENDNMQLYEAGILYELYLRYYVEALRYARYPYPYFTIGSTFAIRADAYVKIGGMNKNQAGEDFYFLQKAFLLDGIVEINDTTVYPEIRQSDRVIFGTGPAIQKMLKKEEISWKTFSLEAFDNLKIFFDSINTLYKINEEGLKDWFYKLPQSMQAFLSKNMDYENKICEINANTSSQINFRKRFFSWFNAFQIIKFLHHIHPTDDDLNDIEMVAAALLQKLFGESKKYSSHEELLEIYRKMQKNHSSDFGMEKLA